MRVLDNDLNGKQIITHQLENSLLCILGAALCRGLRRFLGVNFPQANYDFQNRLVAISSQY